MRHEPAGNAERRAALLAAARRLVAEAGADAAPLMAPELALEIIEVSTADVAAEIDARTAEGIDTLEDLADALIDGVLAGSEAWSDALMLVLSALERMTDFEQWMRAIGSWVGAIERTIVRAQARGLVAADVDPGLTALVLRDVLRSVARSGLGFRFPDARETAKQLMCAALRPARDGDPARG